MSALDAEMLWADAMPAARKRAVGLFADQMSQCKFSLSELANMKRIEQALFVAPGLPVNAPDFLKALASADAGKLDDETRAPIKAVDLATLARMKFRPREPLLSPWLRSQDLAMVFAGRGVGKTHFSLAVAYAVSTGGTFLNWKCERPAKTVYLDGELPGAVLQERLLMHLPDQEPAPGYLRIFTPDLLALDDSLPDLATIRGQELINSMIESDTSLVILDNLSAWARGSRAENDAESWLPIADWVLSLRRRGIAVFLVHHGGKNGEQRGTSKREDLLDAVIKLSRPKDYDPRQGARFDMTFSKARHLHGDAAESLQIQLDTTPEGRAKWSWETREGNTYQQVVELAREGLKQAEIARELEISRSQACRHYNRAKSEGLVK
ncbi:MAG: AAA family ATPase [Thiobacillaceae bacterium]